MFVLDLDGRITWVNARARRPRFGEDPSSLMGSFWRDLWTETQRDAAVERFETASGDSVERFSGALTADLGGAWLDVVLAPIHDAEGRVARLLAMGRDITEQRRVAEERDRLTNRLEETLRLNETFVAAVGHDLRNPLSAVQHGLESVPILMEVSGEPAAVVIEVRNGGAIPSHAMSDLFNPFRGRHGGPRSDGLGLGLFIVQQIALAHGGRVDAESSDGGGTLFRLRIPRGPSVPPSPELVGLLMDGLHQGRDDCTKMSTE